MKALIIGAAGFVGGHLINHLLDCGWTVNVTKLAQENMEGGSFGAYDLDIMDKAAVENLLGKLNPDCIFHLAAQSSVALSWEKPALTMDININGTLNILDAIRSLKINPRILLIGSGEEYGHVLPDEIPLKEDNALRPGNIYAASKACQEMVGKIYANAYGLDIMMVRAFNHIGAGQSPAFVVSSFCKQVAEIEILNKEPVVKVGNLSAKRDFTDVGDVVRAYRILMEKGHKAEVYNVGSGDAIAVDDILKMILSFSSIPITVEVDAARVRPVDIPIITADISKIKNQTGWTPEIDLKKSLLATLEFWRNNLKD
ncbi:MAG: GDP-mannose 4,6-dehydratase [Defluviitaleaceae bacterium]|nr:GDP-mannose 4,6-dehydratase [Defluviitaleaceae bacterium]